MIKKFYLTIATLMLLAFALTFYFGLNLSDRSSQKMFIDVTNDAGIRVKAQNQGISWGDYDNDGYDDLFISNRDSPSILYHNLGNGKFEDVTSRIGLGQHSASSTTFVDVNNDGYLDLLIVAVEKQAGAAEKNFKNISKKSKSSVLRLVLYKNNKGKFEDKTQVAGIGNIKIPGRGTAAFADIDNDGWLDFVLSTNEAIHIYSINGSLGIDDIVSLVTKIENRKPSHLFSQANSMVFVQFPGTVSLFKNTGEGKFVDMSNHLPKLEISGGKFFQPVFFDYDDDNLIDLFIATDFDRSFLLENLGNFNFSDVTTRSGLAEKANWMGVDIGDLNNDEKLDLYVTNVRGDTLFENLGNSNFNINSKLNRESIGWGTTIIDYDNDGWQDIFTCNGETGLSRFNLERHNQVPTFEGFTRENRLYKNYGGKFIKIEQEANDDQPCRGTAASDFDNNGFPDIFVANEIFPEGKGSILYRNSGNKNSWLKIRLKGNKSNQFGVGAKIKVKTPHLTQTKIVTAGNSFYSQSSFEQIFGFGNSKDPIDITVYWPSGTVQQLKKVKLNQSLTITEE